LRIVGIPVDDIANGELRAAIISSAWRQKWLAARITALAGCAVPKHGMIVCPTNFIVASNVICVAIQSPHRIQIDNTRGRAMPKEGVVLRSCESGTSITYLRVAVD